MNHIIKRVARQSKPRLWIGWLRDITQRTQSYQSMMNALLLLVTAYTVREATVHKYLPWLNLVTFLIVAVVLLTIIAWLDHKIIYPSQIAYHQGASCVQT